MGETLTPTCFVQDMGVWVLNYSIKVVPETGLPFMDWSCQLISQLEKSNELSWSFWKCFENAGVFLLSQQLHVFYAITPLFFEQLLSCWFWFYYKLNAVAIVTRKFRTQTIQRQQKFIFKIECLLKRDVSVSSTESFTVAAALINANEEVWSFVSLMINFNSFINCFCIRFF